MNTNFAKQVSLLLSLTAVTIVSSELSVQAQISNELTSPTTPLSIQGVESTNPENSDQNSSQSLEVSNPATDLATADLLSMGDPLNNSAESQANASLPQLNVLPTDVTQTASQANVSLPQLNVLPTDVTQTASQPQLSETPATGSAETLVTTQQFSEWETASAADLRTQPSTLQLLQTPPEETPQVAQADIEPGRRTRSGPSYVGVGFNIGLSGENSALGEGNFEIISKIGLSRVLSVRPSAIIGDNTAFLLPLTYDFNIQRVDPFEPARYAPYVGGGVIVSTGDNSSVGFLLSGGVDVPLSRQFTANAALNIGFLEEDTDVGIRVGVGYNFTGF